MSQHKKWVFTELVKDVDNPEHLIAYAMYKGDKDDQAKQCRARNMGEQAMTKELERFHDSIAHSERQLEDYRQKARRTVNGLVTRVGIRVTAQLQSHQDAMMQQHMKEIAELNNKINKAQENAFKKWTEQALDYSTHLNKPPAWKKAGKGLLIWLFSGIPGLFATVFTTVAIVGVVSLFTTNALQMTKQALKDGLDAIIVDKGGIPASNIEPLKSKNALSRQ